MSAWKHVFKAKLLIVITKVHKSVMQKVIYFSNKCFCICSTSEPPPEGETALFLSGQEMLWKGFINMHTVAKFVTKAYMVSGSFEHLKEVCSLQNIYIDIDI